MDLGLLALIAGVAAMEESASTGEESTADRLTNTRGRAVIPREDKLVEGRTLNGEETIELQIGKPKIHTTKDLLRRSSFLRILT